MGLLSEALQATGLSSLTLPSTVGPVLFFRGLTGKNTWNVGCLVVTKESPDNVGKVKLSTGGTVQGKLLHKYLDWHFIEYEFNCVLGSNETQVTYSFEGSTSIEGSAFVIPAAGTTPRMLFYSCNDTQTDENRELLKDYGSTWRKAQKVSQEEGAIHVAYGGGDQVYCDTVLLLKRIQNWNSKDDRFEAEFTKEMSEDVALEYFSIYMKRYSEKEFAASLKSIPMAMVADDHDFFDGRGSHETKYNNCPVYKGIESLAQNFRLLFQLGVKPDGSEQPVGGYGVKGTSLVHQVSPSVVVAALDYRTERLAIYKCPEKSRLIEDESFSQVKVAVQKAITPQTKHCIVSLFGPIVFPVTSIVMGATKAATGPALDWLLKRVAPGQVGPQNRIDILDDLVDGLDSPYNRIQRDMMVDFFHSLAREKNIRISFVAGDVHCGGFGTIKSEKSIEPKADPYFSRQWITSPMGNIPTDDAVVTLTYTQDFLKHLELGKVEAKASIDREPMKITNTRNFLCVEENVSTHALHASLYSEKKWDESNSGYDVFKDVAPALKQTGGAGDGGCCTVM